MSSGHFSQQPMMASTRQPTTMQIFQDPLSPLPHSLDLHTHYPEYDPSPLRLLENEQASGRGVVFNPPISVQSRHSPVKTSYASYPPQKVTFGSNFNVVAIPPPNSSTSQTDSLKKKPVFTTFDTSRRPQKALFTTFPSSRTSNKENSDPTTTYNDNFAQFPDPCYGQKGPKKRTLQDATLSRDKSAKEPKLDSSVTVHIPEPHEMPLIEDDGMKPPYSYATLIGMSILRAPNRRLTLAQIYKWISDTFSYYRTSVTGWQNSIRHNLSLNKAFLKQERPKDDPGKGNYWAIEPGMEGQFIKDKQARRPAAVGAMHPAPQSEKRGTTRPSVGTLPTAPREAIDHAAPGPSRSIEPSSDATILASDSGVQDLEQEDQLHVRPSSQHAGHSSPPQMNSSPPVATRNIAKQHTPPSAVHLPPSRGQPQQLQSRKRNSAAMNDSGYFSSMDASNIMPHLPGDGLISDADRPKLKRGRAEEEIARIRHSSHDSPRKPRTTVREATPVLSPSSPSFQSHDIFRSPDRSALMPLTPATRNKLLAQAPQFDSPETSLRIHREKMRALVPSPVRGMPALSDEFPWAVELVKHTPQSARRCPTYGPFDTMNETCNFAPNGDNDIFLAPPYDSPSKLSPVLIKRIGHKTVESRAADVTEGGSATDTGEFVAPTLEFQLPYLQWPSRDSSPTKMVDSNSAFYDLTAEHHFEDAFEGPNLESGPDLDILQGFSKIGQKKRKPQ